MNEEEEREEERWLCFILLQRNSCACSSSLVVLFRLSCNLETGSRSNRGISEKRCTRRHTLILKRRFYDEKNGIVVITNHSLNSVTMWWGWFWISQKYSVKRHDIIENWNHLHFCRTFTNKCCFTFTSFRIITLDWICGIVRIDDHISIR